MPIVKTTLPVAGLFVHVYSTEKSSSLPVAAVFLLHGRLSSSEAEQIQTFASSLLNTSNDEPQAKELLVITFDHRNHGSRLINPKSNLSWNTKCIDKHNEKHAVDMYAMQTGAASDVSFLIDFLPAYLYPNGEREIVDWGVIGISLGGHAAWIVLKDGCPDYLSLMEDRARRLALDPSPPLIPQSLRAYVERNDPVSIVFDGAEHCNPLISKRILVLSGAADKLVPWVFSEPFVNRLVVGEKGRKRVVLQEGAGHELTKEMVSEASGFVRQWIAAA
ncbi:hypothetical protein FRB99_005853 [Tulasnella sp. 403]|nr:hypothetical protein FRB99_005853 [Tulasnella sp. 403]